MYVASSDQLSELRETLHRGALIICVGPGLSAAAGLPGRAQLAEELIAIAPEFGLSLDVGQLRRWIARGEATKVLGLLRRRLGANFEREVERRLSDRGIPVPKLARTVARLGDRIRAVYTTGVDRLLERAFAGRWPSFGEARMDFAQRHRLIFKLFGTLEFAKTWALTSEQIEREFSPSSLRRSVFATAFSAHPLLFVGFEPDGDEGMLEQLLGLVAVSDEQSPHHFIIVSQISSTARVEMERRGLQVIVGEAEPMLRELGQGKSEPDDQDLQLVGELRSCPYPGLEAFKESEAAVFLGRHAEVSQAVARLGTATGTSRRWLAIEGPSGVGKSSFLHAGVIPALRAGFAIGAPTRWQVASMRPGERPLDTMAHVVCDALGVLEHDVLKTLLHKKPGALADWLRINKAPGRGFLLVVDQLEEAVTFADHNQREPFGEAIADALLSGELYLATTLRSDFVISLQAKLPSLAGLLNDHAERYALAPISRVGLREAITEPAAAASVVIEPELVELIANDVEDYHRQGREADDGSIRTQQSALPLVAHVLRGLWDAGAHTDGTITVDEYRDLGGVTGALSRSADGILAGFGEQKLERVRALFLRLIKVSRNGADTRQTISRDTAVQLAAGVGENEEGERLLALLSGAGGDRDRQPPARLLVVSEEEGVPRVDLVHEALLREWGTLRGWIDEDRRQLLADDELARKAEVWREQDKPRTGLPSGLDLAELLEGRPHGEQEALQAEYQNVLRWAERQRRLGWVLAMVVVVCTSLSAVWFYRNGEARAVVSEQEAINAWARAEEERSAAQAAERLAQERQAQVESEQAKTLMAQNETNAALRDAEVERDAAKASENRAKHAAWEADSARLNAVDASNAQKGLRASMLVRSGAGGAESLLLAIEGLGPYTTGTLRGRPPPPVLYAGIQDAMTVELWRQSHVFGGHSNIVSEVAFSPDGQRIATASFDHTARVWDVPNGKLIASLEGHSDAVRAVTFSPDGQRIATASFDHTARIWDPSNGKLVVALDGHSDGIFAVAFSPDGQRIATASFDHTTRIWNPSNGKFITSLDGKFVTSLDGSGSAAFSPDGQRIAIIGSDNIARIWNLLNDELAISLDGNSDYVAFSPDGHRISTGSYDDPALIRDASNGKVVAVLEGNWDSVAFSPDGRRIATVGTDTAVWETSSGKLVAVLEGHSVRAVSFSPDGQLIAAPSDDYHEYTVSTWDASSGKPVAVLKGHSDHVSAVAFAPNSQRIATASHDSTARIWDASSGEIFTSLEGHSGIVRAVAFSPDGQRIATASYDTTARVWDASNGKLVVSLKGHADYVVAVAFSPDGQRIATASSDATARIWDASSGELVLALKGHSSVSKAVAFSPDGQRIAAASWDKTGHIWDASSGEVLESLDGHSDHILAVAFSPDGQRIATASTDTTARTWEVLSGKPLASLTGHSGPVTAVAFSPNGQRIATASFDHTTRIWHASSGKLVASLEGHSGPVRTVVYSPNGQHIATASEDHTVRFWDASSGNLVYSLEGHSGDARIVVFSPNGQHVATASESILRVWDASSGKLVASLEGHSNSVNAVAFSSDGQRIVTGSSDHTARIWSMPDTAVKLACARAEQFLSDDYPTVQEFCRE